MATMTYSSNYLSSAVGLNTSSVIAVSGGGGAQAIVESVLAQAYLSTSAYAVTYNVTCRINFSSGYVEVTRSVDFNSGNASGGYLHIQFLRSVSRTMQRYQIHHATV